MRGRFGEAEDGHRVRWPKIHPGKIGPGPDGIPRVRESGEADGPLGRLRALLLLLPPLSTSMAGTLDRRRKRLARRDEEEEEEQQDEGGGTRRDEGFLCCCVHDECR